MIAFISGSVRAHKIRVLFGNVGFTEIRDLRELAACRQTWSGWSAVLVDSFGRWGLLGITASLISGRPLVVRLRGDVFRELDERFEHGVFGALNYVRRLFAKCSVWLVLWRAEGLIANSEYLREIARTWVPKNKWIDVVRNPVTPPASAQVMQYNAGLPQGHLKLLSVPNMTFRSKVDPIVRALESWVDREFLSRLDIQWVICGDGHLRGELTNTIHRQGLQDRVYTIGHVSDMRALYKWCDVLVHLTRLDAFPNATMEALHFGRPVITNDDSGGTREQIFDGVNGRIVSSAASFRAAVEGYALNEPERQRHGSSGMALVEKHFSVEAQRLALAKVFRLRGFR